MIDDIRQQLDAELPAQRVPFALDAEQAVAGGRKAQRRRRLTMAGTGLLSIVAASAVVIATLAPGTGNGEDSPKPLGSNGPAEGLPQLDPDLNYAWGGPPSEKELDDANPSYTQAFWEYLTTQLPQVAPYKLDDGNGGPEKMPATDETAAFTLGSYSLSQITKEDSPGVPREYGPELFTREAYALTQYLGPDPMGGTNAEMLIQVDDHDVERLAVMVLPPDTFTRGTGTPMDPAGCHNDNTFTSFSSCEAVDALGPDGQDIQHVTMQTRDDGAEPSPSGHDVVLYRQDGSAVIVSNESWGDELTLTFDQLAGIALALPQTPVE